jgi:hypothetical protein
MLNYTWNTPHLDLTFENSMLPALGHPSGTPADTTASGPALLLLLLPALTVSPLTTGSSGSFKPPASGLLRCLRPAPGANAAPPPAPPLLPLLRFAPLAAFFVAAADWSSS